MANNNPPNQWMALVNLGWLLVANLAVFLFGGIFLDKHFHTSPLFLIGGMLTAFVGCGFTVYQTVKNLTRDEAEAKPKPSRKPQD